MPNSKDGRRNALIIATGSYQDPELSGLRSPAKDAEELAGVLGNPAIGGFDVQVLLNRPGHLVSEEIDGFFADRSPEDLLVLYLSCHGVMDPSRKLYFAAHTTKLSRLASTGISAAFVYDQIDRCRAQKILLLLDCCYSGAYLKGHRPRADSHAGFRPLDGRGRAVITSCTALEYAFEIDTGQVTGTPAPSVFTAALVEGLRTGDADRDGDGLVSLDDLYGYVFDRVRDATPHQTPEKKWSDVQGDFIVARNPRPPARPEPTPPPASLAGAVSRSPQPSATRRVLLTLAAASTAGLVVTAWDLGHRSTARPPNPITTPKGPETRWTFPGSVGTTLEAARGDFIYVSTGGPPRLSALLASDGRQLWHSKRLVFLAAAGRGIVYANGSRDLYALRAADGHKIWHCPIAGPTGLVTARGILYTVDENGGVYALQAADGTRIWSFATSQDNASGVVVADDVVYTAGINQSSSVYALRAGTELWRSPIGNALGLAVSNGMLYVSNGRLHALRASDGAKIWTSTLDLDLTKSVVTGERLYLIGNYDLCAVDSSSGTVLWKFPAPALAGPFLSGDTVYLADQHEAYALRSTDGTKLWSFEATGRIMAMAMAPAADTVYVASNNLYALRASDGAKLWSFPAEAASVMVAAGGAVLLQATSGEIHALQIPLPPRRSG